MKPVHYNRMFILLCSILLQAVFSQELSFPANVKATYKVIAHQVPEMQEYPSRAKVYKLYYDRAYGGVRIEYKNENGVDIVYIRNYHDGYEARIEKVDDIEICEYSFLGSSMPLPSFPKEIKQNQNRVSNGEQYRTYSYQEHRQYIDIYVNDSLNFPVRVDEYYINSNNNPDPVLSTIFEQVDFSPIDRSLFDVSSLKESGKCFRNSKGWPYQYLVGPFVKA